MANAALLAVTVVIAGGTVSAAGAARLPDGRAYEMVSPPDKNGGDIVADTQRTRAAVDGRAVSFTSLAGFAGNLGTGISNDYVSVRSAIPSPGTNGWATHGIMPPMRALSAAALLAQVSPLYVGEFSPDLDRGVVTTWGAVDGNANVDGVSNLYRSATLRSTGAGPYDLVSACPLCGSASTPLPDYPGGPLGINLRPIFANASPDLDHVAFESLEPLTADTPVQPCDMSAPDISCHAHVFQWDDGILRLAGRVPVLPATECDDAGGPACVPADVSLAGGGTGVSRSASNNRTPHVVSNGSDGHVRLFFTQPTDVNGNTSDDLGNSTDVNQAFSGRIFMRVDGTSTVQLNVSERGTADSYAPAQLLDASVDGRRVFFMTTQALTNDAPADGGSKLYMYDTTKPASAPDNLTFLSAGTGGGVRATIGVSEDGRYVYFVTTGSQIYMWHDGTLTLVGPAPSGLAVVNEDITAAPVNWGVSLQQSRVTPDGRHMVFSTTEGAGLLGYDHGSCTSAIGLGCRELYVYSADTGAIACASCNPSGATATAMATDAVWEHAGAATTTFHLNHAISTDGSRVFFTTAEALVPEDVNRRQDAYEWTAAGTHGCQSGNALTKGCITLLSTGASTSDSYFLDASANGDNAFFITREQLVGWDRDQAYDLYDARVGGGFPEPITPPDCSADACQGASGNPPAAGPIATTVFDGAGNLLEKLKPHARKRCKRGFVRRRVRGKVKCVKKRHHRSRKHARSSTRGAK